MLFKHYIITRFNLRLFPKRTNGELVKNNDEYYLAKRLALFEKYCYPSVKKQTNQNFRWFLLMDIETPDVIKERIRILENNYKNLRVLFLDSDRYNSFDDWQSDDILYYNEYARIVNIPEYSNIQYGTKLQCFVMPRFIKDMILSESEEKADFYLTTRIDNDDAFHCDMVETVQKLFLKDRKCCMYNFLYGYQYNAESNIVQKYYYKNNHFTTLVENKIDTLKSVYYWDHRFVGNFVEVVNVNTKPLWVEMLHGNNVANTFIVSHRNRLLLASLFFKPSDFGYSKSDVSPKFVCALRFALKPFNIRAYLRSIKKRLLSQE